MPEKKKKIDLEVELARELKELGQEIRRLKKLDFMKMFKNPWKFMGYALLKGIMVGFGSVLGATVLVALVIYILAQISFVPIVGDFVGNVIEEMEAIQSPENQNGNSSLFDQYNQKREELR